MPAYLSITKSSGSRYCFWIIVCTIFVCSGTRSSLVHMFPQQYNNKQLIALFLTYTTPIKHKMSRIQTFSYKKHINSMCCQLLHKNVTGFYQILDLMDFYGFNWSVKHHYKVWRAYTCMLTLRVWRWKNSYTASWPSSGIGRKWTNSNPCQAVRAVHPTCCWW
jgi:hypothetical protein